MKICLLSRVSTQSNEFLPSTMNFFFFGGGGGGKGGGVHLLCTKIIILWFLLSF